MSTEVDITSLITNGGFGAGLLGILWIVGNRFLKAMDRLVSKVEDHHVKDIEHHNEVEKKLEGFNSKLETIIGWQERTPIEGSPIPKPSRTKTPPGSYSYNRPRTKPEDDEG